jgi:hypothetical protein
MGSIGGFLSEGFGGIAFDNVDIVNAEGRCGVWRGRRWHLLGYSQRGGYDPRYVRTLIAWARDMRHRIKGSFPGTRISANFSIESWNPYRAGYRLARYFDFLFDEQGVTRNARGLLLGDEWLQKMHFLERLTSHGRHFMLLNASAAPQDQAVSPAEVAWSLASYLMVATPGDYVYVSSQAGYGSFYDRPEYHVQLGTPYGGFYDDGGVWRRDFARGIALANASDSSRTVVLPGTYEDMEGNQLTTATLGPGSGLILRATGT